MDFEDLDDYWNEEDDKRRRAELFRKANLETIEKFVKDLKKEMKNNVHLRALPTSEVMQKNISDEKLHEMIILINEFNETDEKNDAVRNAIITRMHSIATNYMRAGRKRSVKKMKRSIRRRLRSKRRQTRR
jgi:hypothetical protein